ncbi:MAG: 4-hydroxythreonine-4-phosphate dehydrogenase PdxA [Verrucomicrobia bacterium]|nr:4-hydroxythreonine-4-phosphate dehydrogenase PdxA [Verrucomicrobiota bacterium]
MSKPLIAVTMGDPAGVGPEICLQLLANEAVNAVCTPVIFGDARLLSRCARQTGMPAPKRILSEIEWDDQCGTLTEPAVLDLFGFDADDFSPGIVSARTGAAGFRYVEKSIAAALAHQVAAVATAPLNKEALHAAGITYPGHTEMFAEKMAAETIIQPAILAARAKGHLVEGPLPPDTAFIPAKRRSVDAYICLYHDQALIPLKALAFDTAVNTTLGLPVPRTSVDHGTACDIAWQGKANGQSLVEAVLLAAKMASPRM